MSLSKLISRLQNRYQREASHRFARRMIEVRPAQPIISFTFDDFPRSALHQGGAILKQHGQLGTFYVALGLMDTDIPAGRAFSKEDLFQVVADGHELGCHTYAHCHSWNTAPSVFEASIIENQRELQKLIPGAEFKSLSYPIAWPRPQTKQRTEKYFNCCRSGGPTFNLGAADANNLQATFIEKHLENPASMLRLIEETCQSRGWLIFATHDVTEKPSPFGCTPGLFEEVVRAAVNSGAQVMPVGAAWEKLNSK